ncbi:unnamed protein product [Hydatigera taeniaeformis]|uniref:Ovule protein n=1 Tax=Hydatigena taeniaeformis TaxID=6205 RepID=A0A0R3WV92_HYDTA|nr:unnamed protein product [Hydatigera taeniaeformis]
MMETTAPTSDRKEHGGHNSIESQVQNTISSDQSEIGDATYHLEAVREQLTTSDMDNFCKGKSKEGVSTLATHFEEVACEVHLSTETMNGQDSRPGDAFDRSIETRDIPLEPVPAVDQVSSKLQDRPLKSSRVSESSLTEVSSPVEVIVNESERFPVDTGEVMKQRFIELFKAESKKLKAAKAAYLSKKQMIRELKMLLEQGLSLSGSVS